MAQFSTVLSVCLIGALALIAVRGTSNEASPPPVETGAPAPLVESAPKPEPVGNGLAAVTLMRASDSHFYAEAEVNGTPVRFLVDTGASGVVLTAADAQRAGIGGSDFTAIGRGAGGDVSLMPATVTRLALGPLAAENVPVMVAKDKLSISLLGQSYLSRIGSVSINGDRMILQ